jgi:hypothetical protein
MGSEGGAAEELARRLEALNRELAADERAVTAIRPQSPEPPALQERLARWGEVLAAGDAALRRRPRRLGAAAHVCVPASLPACVLACMHACMHGYGAAALSGGDITQSPRGIAVRGAVELVQEGIPGALRAAVWQRLARFAADASGLAGAHVG